MSSGENELRSHVSTFKETSSDEGCSGVGFKSPTEAGRMVTIESQGEKGEEGEEQRQSALTGLGKSQASSRK